MKKYEWMAAVLPVFVCFVAGVVTVTYFATKKLDVEMTDYENKVRQYYTSQERHEEQAENLDDTPVNGQVQTDQQEYFLIFADDRVCIYQGIDRVFYDYAEVNREAMSAELRNQLSAGYTIYGEQSLYEFLQTYSS